MSFKTLDDTLRQRLYQQLTLGGDGGAPITTLFPGNSETGFIDGTGAATAKPNSGVWLEYAPSAVNALQAEQGVVNVLERRDGVLMVVVRGDPTTARASMLSLIDRVATVFRRIAAPNDVVLRTPHHSLIEEDKSGSPVWWRSTVFCPWYQDAIL